MSQELQELLKKEQEKIQARLEQRVQNKGILAEGYQISVVIKIKRKRQYKILPLTDKDWNRIFSTGSYWTDLRRRILEIFKENDGSPLKVEEIMKRLGRWFSPAMFSLINTTLSDRGLPYKICRLNPYARDAQFWQDEEYQIGTGVALR